MKPYRILGGHSKKIDTLFGCTIPGWYRLIVLEKPAQLFGRLTAAVRLVDIAAASITPCAYLCVMVHQNLNLICTAEAARLLPAAWLLAV